MTLEQAIETHRELYRSDTPDRLVSRQPPLTQYRRGDFVEQPPTTTWPGLMKHLQRIELRRQFSMKMQSRLGADEELVVEPGAAVGMPMSGPMLRKIGHPEGYGSLYPWSKALWMLRVECRRRHHDHRSADRPYWRGSLCHEAVKLVVIGGESGGTGPLSPEHAGRILRIDRIDELLLRAFRFLEESMDSFRRRAELRAREDEGRGDGAIPVPRAAHHAVPGLHKQDCPQCRRAA
jgi:hypothetical protein